MSPKRTHPLPTQVALLALACLGSAAARADIYDDAAAHVGRTAKDVKRDAIDHPVDVLRLAGIKPGMRVADILGANGYYSELLSYIVGPKGHVYLLNNVAFDNWSQGHWKERIDGRLPNVEHRTVDLEHLNLPGSSLDAVLLIKVYHDLYWVDEDPKDQWPKYDVNRVLNEVARVLKPGGILVLVDHRPSPVRAARMQASCTASMRPTRRRILRSMASSSSARATCCAAPTMHAISSPTKGPWSVRRTGLCCSFVSPAEGLLGAAAHGTVGGRTSPFFQ